MKALLLLVIAPCFAFAQEHASVNIPPPKAGTVLRSLDPKKDMTHYIHRVWQAEQGLPQNSAQALCQTRDGYLWIGTEEGLVRFDGARFTIFDTKNTPGLKANAIQALLEDRSGALWIGTSGGGISRWKDGQCTAYTTADGLSSDFVSSLLEDRSDAHSVGEGGAIWVGTLGGGVNYFKDGKFTALTTQNGLSHNLVFTLLQDRMGDVWIGTNGGGVNRLHNGVLTAYTTQNGLSHNLVRALLEDRDGAIWIGTFGGGLNRFKDGKFTAFTTENGLSHNLVWSLREDQLGTLWIGTFGGGLNRFRDGVFSTFSTKNGLSSDLVRSILEDREGTLWVGTVGGLNCFKDGIFTTFSTLDGLSHDVVRTLTEKSAPVNAGKGIRGNETPNKEMWIGTFGGGVNLLKGGRAQAWTARTGLSSDIIYTLLEDRSAGENAGTLWIGTNGGGLNRLHNGTITTYTTKNGLANDVVYTLVQERSTGALWIGTNGGGLNRLADGKFTNYTTKDGLSSNNIRTMLEDRSGALWIGTVGGGLNRLQNGTFTVFTTANGLAHNNVRSLFQDGEGTLWIGTVGGGLSRYKDGTFTSFTTANGLFDDVVHCIVEDDYGYLWMSSNKGISRVRKGDVNAFAERKLTNIPCESFGITDGMRSAECNSGNPAGWKDSDGHLWFATMAGAVTVNPGAVLSRANSLAPPVIIESIVADSVRLDVSSPATAQAGAEKFEFYYTATSLFAPERVKFKYLLEGYDKHWVDAGTRRTAYYTNLQRGRNYRFRVIACNNDGVWNETGAVVILYLTPHFWETWWFYGLCALALVSVGTGAYRVRVRHLHRRAEILEKTVEVRTAELRESNEEIQHHLEELDKQAHEIELSNLELRGKNLQLEALHQEKNEFLGIVAHDLKNPLSSIALTASLIHTYRQRHGAEWIDEQMNKIEEMTGRMTSIITNLLDVNALESGNYNFHVEDFDIVPIVAMVVREYRSKSLSKNIGIIAELPPENTTLARADSAIVQGILDNLLSNAVKYSPHGKHVFVRVVSADAAVRIEVQDEGQGISEEDMKKLFGKFARLSAQPTGGEHSTGLGLSIVKKMVAAMQGKVWCESEVGRGATFIVELPKPQSIHNNVSAK
jgi:ligand-binding sensor domain-containing protein/signal transduction histidine kinase